MLSTRHSLRHQYMDISNLQLHGVSHIRIWLRTMPLRNILLTDQASAIMRARRSTPILSLYIHTRRLIITFQLPRHNSRSLLADGQVALLSMVI